MNRLIQWIIHLKMGFVRFGIWKPFLRKLRQPERVQSELLDKILLKQRDTAFGGEHGFDSIKTYVDFIKKVPIHHFEDLRPYIEKQEAERIPALNREQPILYAQTSGTTDKPKLIPILQRTVESYKLSQQIFSYANYSAIPSLYSGKILAIVSPAIEGYLPTGTPYGSLSGLLYQTMPRLLRSKYLLPIEVFEISDYALKYYILAAFAMAEENISFVASANPSTFLKIASVIQGNASSIIRDIQVGELTGLEKLDASTRLPIQACFQKNEKRAKELSTLFDRGETINSDQLWPHLKAIFTWLGGSCQIYLPALKSLLHPSVHIIEMGYLASEFRGSIVVDSLNNLAVPAIHENFFEFAEQDQWDMGIHKIKTIEQVESGKPYYLIVTTQSGLYRYFINDVVLFGEPFLETPTVKFLEKGSGVTNLTGEKLHENQVIEAMNQLFQQFEIPYSFFLFIAIEEESAYHLFMEDPGIDTTIWIDSLDAQLSSLNIEYQSKRASGRLHQPVLKLLVPGTGDIYKKHCLQSGQREAQFKLLCLQTNKKLQFDLNPYLLFQT